MQINSVGPNFTGVKVDYEQISKLGKNTFVRTRALQGIEKAMPEIKKMAEGVDVKIGFANYGYGPCLLVKAQEKGFLKNIRKTAVSYTQQIGSNFSPENILKKVETTVSFVKQKIAAKASYNAAAAQITLRN